MIPGNRVKVYGPGLRNGQAVGDAGSERKGKILQRSDVVEDEGDYFCILLDGASQSAVFHVKQCRPLKKKEKTNAK